MHSAVAVMSAFLFIVAIEAVILLAVWQWDERARRAELHRRRLQLMQTRSQQSTSAAAPFPAPPSSVPTAAA
jgi:hypothetical protein